MKFLPRPRIFQFLAFVFCTGLLITTMSLKAFANGAEIQVRNNTSYQANQVNFKQVEYVGQCPGTVLNPGAIKARFISRTTPPGKDRRVVIRNVSEGMRNNPYPFTNRGYDGQFSEGFDISFNEEHKTRTFSVLEGTNLLEYEITEGKTVLEQGKIELAVDVQPVGTFPREVICEEKLQCRNDGDCYDQDGKKRGNRQRCYTTTECRCP